jgi:hypothetical protein
VIHGRADQNDFRGRGDHAARSLLVSAVEVSSVHVPIDAIANSRLRGPRMRRQGQESSL